jgi:hypothetical protein
MSTFPSGPEQRSDPPLDPTTSTFKSAFGLNAPDIAMVFAIATDTAARIDAQMPI